MSELMTDAYICLLLFGAGLCVWLMQLIAHRNFIIIEPAWLMQSRRVGLTILGLGLLWAARYGVERGWTPWTPDLVIVGAIDYYLCIAIASGYYHSRAYGNSQRASNIKAR